MVTDDTKRMLANLYIKVIKSFDPPDVIVATKETFLAFGRTHLTQEEYDDFEKYLDEVLNESE